MNDKDFRIIITESKISKGGVVFDERITEEQYVWLMNYLILLLHEEKKKL